MEAHRLQRGVNPAARRVASTEHHGVYEVLGFVFRLAREHREQHSARGPRNRVVGSAPQYLERRQDGEHGSESDRGESEQPQRGQQRERNPDAEFFDELRHHENLAEERQHVDGEIHSREQHGALAGVGKGGGDQPRELEVGESEQHRVQEHVGHDADEIGRTYDFRKARPCGSADQVARLGECLRRALGSAGLRPAKQRVDAHDREAEENAGHEQQVRRSQRGGESVCIFPCTNCKVAL